MENKILIFSATYNEAENIENFLNSINELNLELDVLLIDDNSPDNTKKIISNYIKNKKNIHLIVREKKDGLDTAHKIAYEYSLTHNYQFLITMDSDMSHDPKKIPEFINELKTNSFVIGSRYIPGGKCNMKGWRLFFSHFGNKFCKFIFNIDCNEFTTSYRGFNLKELGDFHIKNVTSKGYSFLMETVYIINNKGINIKQIPIDFKERGRGNSKIPKIELLRTFLNVLRLKIKGNT